MILTSALAIGCACCGCGSDDFFTWTKGSDDFTRSLDVSKRIEALKRLLPEETYDTITAGSRDNLACRESNREDLRLSDLPNGQWYYTYNKLIAGMAQLKEFASVGNQNTRKLEIAAFLANIAQETGAKGAGDLFGGPACFIQEGAGRKDVWEDCGYGGCAPTGKGYIGRGPHQLSWNCNYEAFGKAMGVGKKYLNDPDILTKNPKIGIAGSIWFWGHEEYTQWSPPDIPFKPSAHDVVVGNWTPTNSTTPGVRTSNDVSCNRTEATFGVVINLINGGRECGPGATEEGRVAARNRVSYLEAIAEEMGVNIPDGFSDNCSLQNNFSVCPSY